MPLRFLIVLISLVLSNPCLSQDWVYAGASTKGDKYYVRNSSTEEYEGKKVWTKQVSKTITYKKGNKTYTLTDGYCLNLRIYDCSGRRFKLVSFAYYNSKGTVVYSYQFPDYLTEWQDVFPDSIGEMLLDKVCELF